MRTVRLVLVYLWASPYTLVGLSLGMIGLLSGGRIQRHGRVIEFHGGLVSRFLEKMPTGITTLGMTWGHVILGQTEAALDIVRQHELIHVRQYERWGGFFGPAYLVSSLVAWRRGMRPYRDNHFEREAYGDHENC